MLSVRLTPYSSSFVVAVGFDVVDVVDVVDVDGFVVLAPAAPAAVDAILIKIFFFTTTASSDDIGTTADDFTAPLPVNDNVEDNVDDDVDDDDVVVAFDTVGRDEEED